jgi:hypothetical protein
LQSDDTNHKLDASVRFVCSRVLYRRVRLEARRVKRRTVSEFVRTVLEAYLDALPTAPRP